MKSRGRQTHVFSLERTPGLLQVFQPHGDCWESQSHSSKWGGRGWHRKQDPGMLRQFGGSQ